MAIPVDTWPFAVLPPADLNWFPGDQVNTGGTSLSGLQEIDRLDGGPIWNASLVRIPLWERAQILAFQALQMSLAGGASPIILPRRPSFRSPGAAAGASLVPHSDGTPFSDGSLYSGATVISTLVGDHDLRAYQLTITLTGGEDLIGGEDFSINHEFVGWRMYRVVRVVSRVGDTYQIEIGPYLRDDVPGGTEIEWDNPRCAMKLSNPASFNTALTFNRWGYVNADFEEAFW